MKKNLGKIIVGGVTQHQIQQKNVLHNLRSLRNNIWHDDKPRRGIIINEKIGRNK